MSEPTTRYEMRKLHALELAKAAIELGLKAYIAKTGTYGFITDGRHVVGFDCDLHPGQLTGNHYPACSQYGTGWVIGAYEGPESLTQAMVTLSPYHKARTTLAQYLEQYQSSSKFAELLWSRAQSPDNKPSVLEDESV